MKNIAAKAEIPADFMDGFALRRIIEDRDFTFQRTAAGYIRVIIN